MGLTEWLSILLICGLGAAMPGPSLAVVIQNTLRGGFAQGVVTSVAHALGVAVYAVLTVTGLALVLEAVPTVFWLLQVAGALFLIYLGLKTAFAKSVLAVDERPQTGVKSAWDGFLIAFLNPKLFIFFTALFSQFVSLDSSWGEKTIMVATASVVDGLWYCLVALLISRGQRINIFSGGQSVYLQRFFAVLLIGLGLRLIVLQF